MIPLPSKWIIQFGDAITTDELGPGAADDPMIVFNITDQVRETIQQTLYRLLMQRRSAFFYLSSVPVSDLTDPRWMAKPRCPWAARGVHGLPGVRTAGWLCIALVGRVRNRSWLCRRRAQLLCATCSGPWR